jgi:hypothetical protein
MEVIPMWTRRILATVATLAAATAAQDVDGVLEINQTCAVNTGCFAGDTAGFPITINTQGSYVLTSNLDLPDVNTTGIEVTVGIVTIDMNGFAILAAGGSGSGKGVECSGLFFLLTIRNGKIVGVGNDGIQCGFALVEDMQLAANGGDGASGTGIVRSSIFYQNGGFGVSGSFSVEGSTFSDNTSGSIGNSVVPVGGNRCPPEDLCTSDDRRAFYLTSSNIVADSVLTACDTGFHMASLWEIFDVSRLRYDTTRGYTSADSGSGPPSTYHGWIRTGFTVGDWQAPGSANCFAWTSNSAAHLGTLVNLHPDWERAAEFSSPWLADTLTCNSGRRVWCVQD